MEAIVKERGDARKRATRTINKYAGSDFASLASSEIIVLSNKVKALIIELGKYNKAIHLHPDFDEALLDDYLDAEEAYDDKLGELLVRLEQLESSRSSTLPPVSIVADSSVGIHARPKVYLPQIELPKFSNKKEENIKKFLNTFEAIIEKHRFNELEKFFHLKAQLSGGPLALVNSLDGDKQRYSDARKLLVEAFDNILNSKYDSMKRLSE